MKRLLVFVTVIASACMFSRASEYTDRFRAQLNEITAKMAAQERENAARAEESHLIAATSCALWKEHMKRASADEVRREAEKMANWANILRDEKDVRRRELELAEVDARLDRIQYGRRSRSRSVAGKHRALNRTDFRLTEVEQCKGFLRELQTKKLPLIKRPNKRSACKSFCGFEFGKCYLQPSSESLEEKVTLPRPFRYFTEAILTHDPDTRKLVDIELVGTLPRTDMAFVADEFVKTILIFEDKYGVVFPLLNSRVLTSACRDGKEFYVFVIDSEISCGVRLEDEQASQDPREDGQDGHALSAGADADVLGGEDEVVDNESIDTGGLRTGAVVLSIALFCVILAIFLLVLRRRRRKDG